MEWLDKHNDCPVCRKSMWSREAFVKAKKQVLKENPELLKMEMVAALAVEETMDTAAAAETIAISTSAAAGNEEHDEENPNSTSDEHVC